MPNLDVEALIRATAEHIQAQGRSEQVREERPPAVRRNFDLGAWEAMLRHCAVTQGGERPSQFTTTDANATHPSEQTSSSSSCKQTPRPNPTRFPQQQKPVRGRMRHDSPNTIRERQCQHTP